MPFQIIADSGDTIIPHASLPTELKPNKVFDASKSFSHPSADFSLHSLHKEDFTIYYHSYSIRQNSFFYKRAMMPMLLLYVIIKNDFHLDIEGLGRAKYMEGQFNLVYLPSVYARMEFNPGEYASFCIQFSSEYLTPFVRFCKKLEGFLAAVEQSIPGQLTAQYLFAPAKMMIAITDILEADSYSELNELYIGTKVMEILIHAVNRANDQPHPGPILAAEDIEKLNFIKHWVEQNLRDPGKLVTIARQLGWNKNKLTRNFRRLFGSTVFDYITLVRMQKAKQLLLETDMKVTEIAYNIGFERVSTFSRAFKKHYGISPLPFRKG